MSWWNRHLGSLHAQRIALAWFRRLALGIAAAILLSVSALPSDATAAGIAYQAIDLPDVGTGDLWELRYFVSNVSFDAGSGFSVLFDPDARSALTILPSHDGSQWDLIAIQPEPLLPSPGRYDAQALVGSASLSGVFSLTFLVTGSPLPGAQAFEIYDASFEVVETGTTVPVPEPGSAALLALGLGGLAAHAQRGRSRAWRAARARRPRTLATH